MIYYKKKVLGTEGVIVKKNGIWELSSILGENYLCHLHINALGNSMNQLFPSKEHSL